MPFAILPDGRGHYRVINKLTKRVHAKHSTLAAAHSQVRLLESVSKDRK